MDRNFQLDRMRHFSRRIGKRIRSYKYSSAVALAVVLCGLASTPCVALAQTNSSNVSGTWLFSCTTRKGITRQIAIQFQQDGFNLSGNYNVAGRSGAISGNIQGDQISFSTVGKRSLSFSGQLSNDGINGKTQKGRPCSATRE